ncbi:cyclin-dependent kinase 5 activator 1-like [Trichomycterus rosablanca]|uniref:cyclin-dependent kinase 5 activator 1-like n=1 Tax=Trichomycterus rosablanca TaxID=2290929 RepID=UPI002F35E8A2
MGNGRSTTYYSSFSKQVDKPVHDQDALGQKKKAKAKKGHFFSRILSRHCRVAPAPETEPLIRPNGSDELDEVSEENVSNQSHMKFLSDVDFFAKTHEAELILMNSSLKELLQCLGEFLCRRCSQLKSLTPVMPTEWLLKTDFFLTLVGWQNKSYIEQGSVVFLYALCREIISAEVASVKELRSVLLTCLYVYYSYAGYDICYPVKPFIKAQNKQVFWKRVLDIIYKTSRKMLLLHTDPEFFLQVLNELKSGMTR